MLDYIYSLRSPYDGEVRYIGKSNNPKARYHQHICASSKKNTPVYLWIKSLIWQGKFPVLVIECQTDNWKFDERRVIREYLLSGSRLFNINAGGNQPSKSPEMNKILGKKNSIARVSTPLKRKIYELKRSIGLLLKQGHVNERTKAKLRYAALKRPDLFGCYADIT